MEETCPRCGSTKIMPDVPMLDHFGRYGGMCKQAEVRVAGSPRARFFRDRAVGKLFARICGECGHTELWTSNAPALYEKARAAAGGDRPPTDTEPGAGADRPGD